MNLEQTLLGAIAAALVATVVIVLVRRSQGSGGEPGQSTATTGTGNSEGVVGTVAQPEAGTIGNPSPDDKCVVFAEDRLQCGDTLVGERECLALTCCYGRQGGQAFNCYHPAGSQGARWAERTGMMRLCLKKKGLYRGNTLALSTEHARSEMVKAVQRQRGGDQSGLSNAELLARLGCAIGGTYHPAAAAGVDCGWARTYRCPSSTLDGESALKYKGKHRDQPRSGSALTDFTPHWDACCRERTTGWSTDYPDPE